MKLAINYSIPAAELVQAGIIEIDLFKTPDWDWIINEAKAIKPVTIHYRFDAGNSSLEQVDWNKVDEFSKKTGTPYTNLHLDARGSYYPGIPVDTKNKAEVESVFKTIRSDIMKVVDKFGAERTIVENCFSLGEGGNTMRLCNQPELITRLVEETGCGFLLDISHAMIAAKTIGLKPDVYLSRLPVHKLKEMHFTGIHHFRETGLWMDHLAIRKQDWHWLDWVLDRLRGGEWSPPWLLVFEYGGIGQQFEWRTKPGVIKQQVPMLYERVKAVTD